MRRFLRDNGLTVFFLTFFLTALVGQSVAGQHAYNADQLQHDQETVSYGRYLASSSFGRAVLENWQSEWLQFVLFILATVWLAQRGSNESKAPEERGLESDQKQLVKGYAKPGAAAWARANGWRLWIYSNSLLIVMLVLFLGSWFAQSVTGWTEYNDEQGAHDETAVGYGKYVSHPHFWEQSLQNWQSEFLAVAAMAIFTVYLRQRGSPESKPVGAPHGDATGTSG